MPNHIYNEITLKDVLYADARKVILNKDGDVDFGVLLPLPLNGWPGSAGILHKQEFPSVHLDDARKIWGTKWGPYGDPKLVRHNDGVTITFQTAWTHPRGWVCALFNTFNCDILCEWLDEGYFDGTRETWSKIVDGDMTSPSWKSEKIPEKSPDHRRLHKALHGVEEFEV